MKTSEFMKTIKSVMSGSESKEIYGYYYQYLYVEFTDGEHLHVSLARDLYEIMTMPIWDFIEEKYRGTERFEAIMESEELRNAIVQMYVDSE